uniref:K-box domain-containing protein n=1 Tax=Peronospora matthiolae TaxID=2874970 RepID=A0AAV1UPF7_9STRA
MTRPVTRAISSALFFHLFFFFQINFTPVCSSEPSLPPTLDLTVHNFSVYRVPNVESAAAAAEGGGTATRNTSLSTSVSSPPVRNRFLSLLVTPFVTTRQRPVSVTNHMSHTVIATWDDHPFAAHLRILNSRQKTAIAKKNGHAQDAATDAIVASYAYEVQMWVTTWTSFYGLWHEANQLRRTLDPLLVVKDLPVEELEMQFRVRLKARLRPTSLLEQMCVFCCFLLPVDVCGPSEVVGDWSDVVTVSAAVDESEDEQVEALVALFGGDPFMAVLVTLCIGSSCFVVVHLYVRRRRAGQRSSRWWSMQSCIWSSTGKSHEIDAERKTSGEAALGGGRSDDCSKTVQQLEHEIRDLRQELADSEYEVRRLMLFRGYGIETLGRDELKQLEGELQHTLERIRELNKRDMTMLEAED